MAEEEEADVADGGEEDEDVDEDPSLRPELRDEEPMLPLLPRLATPLLPFPTVIRLAVEPGHPITEEDGSYVREMMSKTRDMLLGCHSRLWKNCAGNRLPILIRATTRHQERRAAAGGVTWNGRRSRDVCVAERDGPRLGAGRECVRETRTRGWQAVRSLVSHSHNQRRRSSGKGRQTMEAGVSLLPPNQTPDSRTSLTTVDDDSSSDDSTAGRGAWHLA